MFQKKSRRENQNAHFVFSNIFPKILSFVRKSRKNLWNGAGYRWQYGSRASHAGYTRLQTHTLMLL